jgi:hypothetical protein
LRWKSGEVDVTLPDAKEWRALDEAAGRHEQFMLDSRQARAQRRLYASKLFGLSKCWLWCMLGIVFISSLRPDDKGCFTGFRIDNSVLITLLTTTTAAVIGLFAIFAKWLFPSDPPRAGAEPRDPS